MSQFFYVSLWSKQVAQKNPHLSGQNEKLYDVEEFSVDGIILNATAPYVIIIDKNQNQMETKIKAQRKQEGRWTKAEHKKFLKALEKYGRNWPLIQKKIKTRSLTQIRSHAYKIFIHVPEEDLDAFIGYDGNDCQLETLKRGKEKETSERKRFSSRIQEKLEKPKIQSQNEESNPQLSNSCVKMQEKREDEEKLNENFVQNPISDDNKEGSSNIDSTLKDELSPEPNQALELLQSLETDQFGGNFLFAVMNQLAINNALKMLNFYSFFSS